MLSELIFITLDFYNGRNIWGFFTKHREYFDTIFGGFCKNVYQNGSFFVKVGSKTAVMVARSHRFYKKGSKTAVLKYIYKNKK